MRIDKLLALGPVILALMLALTIACALLSGCANAQWRKERDAWQTVPDNCKVDYDATGRIVASYCKVMP